jgi:hypothetical protein
MQEDELIKSRKEKMEPSDPRTGKDLSEPHASSLRQTPLLSAFQILKDWTNTVVLPPALALGAIVLAAFLLFPAYRGLVSGRRINQLEVQISGLQQALEAERSHSSKLDRELSQREFQLRQRQRSGTTADTGVGLFISPLVSLEPRRKTQPDLISINFTQSDRAILVFSLPKIPLEEIEANIFQEKRLVWNQIIPLPQGNPSNQNLVAFVLASAILPAGNYRLLVEGNPTKQRVALAQFDLAVEL